MIQHMINPPCFSCPSSGLLTLLLLVVLSSQRTLLVGLGLKRILVLPDMHQFNSYPPPRWSLIAPLMLIHVHFRSCTCSMSHRSGHYLCCRLLLDVDK